MEMRWEQSREECQPQGRERSWGKRIYMPDAIAGKITKLREARLNDGRQLREDCIFWLRLGAVFAFVAEL